MSKVLLVYEDYTEMMAIETALKRVGFDPVGINSELSLSKHIVELNPDFIVACGKGSKVNTLHVGKKLKDMVRWHGRVILIFSPSLKPTGEDIMKIRMDLIMEAPVKPEKLIQIIAKLGNLDEVALLEKLHKTHSSLESKDPSFLQRDKNKNDETIYITGGQADAESLHNIKGKYGTGPTKNKEKNSAGEHDSEEKTLENSGSLPKEKDSDSLAFEKEIQKLMGTASVADPETSPQANFTLPKNEDGTSANLDQNGDDESFWVKGSKSPPKNSVDFGNDEDLETAARDVHQELQRSRDSDQERVSKYSKFLQGLQLHPQSSLTRRKTRKAQMEILQGTTEEKLESQDELRREFTRSLFKKNA